MTLVCGFSDLAAGLGALAWDLGTPGALLLSDGKVQSATAKISADDGPAEVEISTEGASVEVTLAPRTAPAPLPAVEGSESPGGGLEAAICTATVRSKGWGRSLQCAGHLTRWNGDPLEGAGTFRHVAIEGTAGSLLIVVGRGRPGESGHGEEQTAAWLLDSEGGITAFGEALLSTQYDDDGLHTRAGLELWPEGDEQTSRAAATRAAGTRLGGSEQDGVSAALFRCSTEGDEGLGSYLIWRS